MQRRGTRSRSLRCGSPPCFGCLVWHDGNLAIIRATRRWVLGRRPRCGGLGGRRGGINRQPARGGHAVVKVGLSADSVADCIADRSTGDIARRTESNVSSLACSRHEAATGGLLIEGAVRIWAGSPDVLNAAGRDQHPGQSRKAYWPGGKELHRGDPLLKCLPATRRQKSFRDGLASSEQNSAAHPASPDRPASGSLPKGRRCGAAREGAGCE
jgi:hypothetical protein